MKVKIFFLISLFVLISSVPTIDVYVESLCPDCMDFITGSFKEFLNHPDHAKLASVNFYPYGNAHETKIDKGYEFSCQHGPNECLGNIIETCALNNTSIDEGQRILVCIEENIVSYGKDFPKTLNHCVTDEDLRAEILNCAYSQEGNFLEHEVAKKTPSDHKYVPWIVVDGEHDVEAESKILSDMVGYLCGLQDYSLSSCKKPSLLFLESVENFGFKRCMKN